MVTSSSEKKTTEQFSGLLILGVHLKHAGYPNVAIRTQFLARQFKAEEINYPFRRVDFARHGPGKVFAFAATAARFLYVNLLAALALWKRAGKRRFIYVPYPAFFLLLLLSFFPKRRRPILVADAFLSVLDTVIDRSLSSGRDALSWAIRRAERRAYRAADMLLVDTRQNAHYFVETYRLKPSNVFPVPLSIDEAKFRPAPYSPQHTCNVVFIGTFVPLQGVDVIAEAICRLRHDSRIQFTLIGDGQTASSVERIFAEERPKNFTWIREWQPAERLAAEIERADICLGIFGSGEKTQRVWPLKNYSYMAVGRAIITGDTACARDLVDQASEPPFFTVPINNSLALAQAIATLADRPDLRRTYAEKSRDFYQRWLANHRFEEFSKSWLTVESDKDK